MFSLTNSATFSSVVALIAFVYTHLVRKSMHTMMYFFYFEGGLIGPDTDHIGWYTSSHLDEEWAKSVLLAIFWRQSSLLQNGLHKPCHDRSGECQKIPPPWHIFSRSNMGQVWRYFPQSRWKGHFSSWFCSSLLRIGVAGTMLKPSNSLYQQTMERVLR